MTIAPNMNQTGTRIPQVPGRGGRATAVRTATTTGAKTGALLGLHPMIRRAAAAKKAPKAPGAVTPESVQLPGVFGGEDPLLAKARSIVDASLKAAMAQVPSAEATSAPFNSQRDYIAKAVSNLQQYLDTAKVQSVDLTNALSTAQQAGATGIAQQAAASGGGGPVTPSVSPSASALPIASRGTSFANYLGALQPYATAAGIGHASDVTARESGAQQSRTDAIAKLAGVGADETQTLFGKLAQNRSDNQIQDKRNKAALEIANKATLAAAVKNGTLTPAQAEKIRHDKVTETQNQAKIDAAAAKADLAATAAKQPDKATQRAAKHAWVAGLENVKGLMSRTVGDTVEEKAYRITWYNPKAGKPPGYKPGKLEKNVKTAPVHSDVYPTLAQMVAAQKKLLAQGNVLGKTTTTVGTGTRQAQNLTYDQRVKRAVALLTQINETYKLGKTPKEIEAQVRTIYPDA